MATQTGTTLKTYFNTGDKPTEAQFVDLIDSNLNLTDGGNATGVISSSNHLSLQFTSGSTPGTNYLYLVVVLMILMLLLLLL